MRAALAGSLLAVLAGLGLSGCAGNSLPRSDTTASSVEPRCSRGDEGAAANGVILMAQSVPTASWVPCLRRALPPGWDFGGLKARDGIAQFSLTSGNDQEQVIQVRLQPSCDTRGSTEIHSDRDGMQRFERVTQTTPGFVGRRYYVFEGGCITFGFTLGPDNRGEPLALAGQVVGAVTRADLSEQVHDESDGRLSLDPVGNG